MGRLSEEEIPIVLIFFDLAIYFYGENSKIQEIVLKNKTMVAH